MTLIPLKVIENGFAKVLLGVAKGNMITTNVKPSNAASKTATLNAK